MEYDYYNGRSKRSFSNEKDDFEDEVYKENYIEEDEEEFESGLLDKLDPELLEILNESRVISNKKTPTKTKKKKKDKIIYEVGEKVRAKNNKYTVLYGPYESDSKLYYELESENGNVVAIEEKYISRM